MVAAGHSSPLPLSRRAPVRAAEAATGGANPAQMRADPVSPRPDLSSLCMDLVVGGLLVVVHERDDGEDTSHVLRVAATAWRQRVGCAATALRRLHLGCVEAGLGAAWAGVLAMERHVSLASERAGMTALVLPIHAAYWCG